MRLVPLLIIALSLCLVTTAFAQEDTSPDDQNSPVPSGPALQASNYAPTQCDPSLPGYRYVEVRGSGFDSWADQHLVGNVVDGAGAVKTYWSSVWVTPQGNLTLEVNLCADPFQNHGALDPGDYTVTVGQPNGQPIAWTAISVSEPPDTSDTGQTQPVIVVPTAQATAAPAAQATPSTNVIPNAPGQTGSTPMPVPGLVAPLASPGPTNGLGSMQQPFPRGAPGKLVDGWQLVITSVSPDAYNDIKAAVPSAIAPPTDQRDYEVSAQATYLGPGTGTFSDFRLALISTTTHQVYDEIVNNCGAVPQSLPPVVVTSGTTVSGNICYTVHASDVGSLLAFDNQSNAADQVYFTLQ